MPDAINNEPTTLAELECRWQKALESTRNAVSRHPDCYRELKKRVTDIVAKPLDVREYLPTAEKVANLLKALDPEEQGSIFCFFSDRIKPADIWQVALLRVECKDLLSYLKVFDDWRMKSNQLRVVK